MNKAEKKKYIKTICDGVSCILEPHESVDYEDCTSEEIYLTEDEFDNLPEFEGF